MDSLGALEGTEIFFLCQVFCFYAALRFESANHHGIDMPGEVIWPQLE